MAAIITATNEEHLLCQEYYGYWKITNLLELNGKKFLTPEFSPIPLLNVKFRFELNYKLIRCPYCNASISIFSPILEKVHSSDVPGNMKLLVDMKINYEDGTLFKKYEGVSVTVKDVDYLYFGDEITYGGTGQTHKHTEQMNKCDSLELKCRMKFFDHLCAMPINGGLYFMKLD